MIPIDLDRASEVTLQKQVYEHIRDLILSGRLRPEQPLPGSRRLAAAHRISRNTVSLAYDRLMDEGYLKVGKSRRTLVAQTPPDRFLTVRATGAAREIASDETHTVTIPELRSFDLSPGTPEKERINFFPGRPDKSCFPLQAWRRILLRVMDRPGFSATEYPDPIGLPELRKAIARQIGATRGIETNADCVIVTGGIQDALNIATRLILKPGGRVVCEDPCYRGFSDLMCSLGIEIHPVPVDDDGIQTKELPDSRTDICYVTPSHQFPTGVTLTTARRRTLIEWASEVGAYVIEDDYDSDFRYDGPPLTALAGIARNERVLYCGTFSKSLGPGLRLGYLVVPLALAQKARKLKALYNHGNSVVEQMAMTEFLLTGQFERHVRRIRQLYKLRRDLLITGLRSSFENSKISGTLGGMHIMLRMGIGGPSAESLCHRLCAKGMLVDFVGGKTSATFTCKKRHAHSLIMGYAAVSEEQIFEALQTLQKSLVR